MPDYENAWDERLKIRTVGRDDINADEYRYPYEPTPYCVLERLAEQGFISEENKIIDYGCGKGRVGFFLADQTGADTIGIEYDERIYRDAVENRASANAGDRTSFIHARAETYPVPPDVDRCYFFNPFSVEILHKVMARILESYYEHPREILLFFYYPSADYLAYLMTVDELDFFDEIDCDDLFDGDDIRERIMVFAFSDYENEGEA